MRVVTSMICVLAVASGCEKRADGPPAGVKPVASAAAVPTPLSSGSAAAAPIAAAPGSAATTIDLVPSASFGPLSLGARKTDIEAMGILKTHPQYSGMTIPYTVYYDDAGRATRIQLSLAHAPADVAVGAVTIPRTATFDDVKRLLADCKDEPLAVGGMTSKCRGGAVNVSVGSASATEVWLEAAVPQP